MAEDEILHFAQGIAPPTAFVQISVASYGRRSHELVAIHEFSRVLQRQKRTPTKYGGRRDSALCAGHRAADGFRVNFTRPMRTALARTRGNSRVLTRLTAPKKDTENGVLFLAQKTRFELVLRFSHTTPLAGEPLEPLGYFCMAHIQKL